MALAATRRRRVLVSGGLNPLWRRIVDLYLDSPEIETELVPHKDGRLDPAEVGRRMGEDVAALLVQHPNAFGLLEESRGIRTPSVFSRRVGPWKTSSGGAALISWPPSIRSPWPSFDPPGRGV
jgi:hypothetical protein